MCIDQCKIIYSTLLLVGAAKERCEDGWLHPWAAEVLKLKAAAGLLAPNLGPVVAMEEEG